LFYQEARWKYLSYSHGRDAERFAHRKAGMCRKPFYELHKICIKFISWLFWDESQFVVEVLFVDQMVIILWFVSYIDKLHFKWLMLLLLCMNVYELIASNVTFLRHSGTRGFQTDCMLPVCFSSYPDCYLFINLSCRNWSMNRFL